MNETLDSFTWSRVIQSQQSRATSDVELQDLGKKCANGISMLDPLQRKEILKAVENANFLSLEANDFVLKVKFGGQFAVIAPEDYQRRPGDPPVFFYREFLGLARNGNRKMFEQMLEIKSHWPEARAEGMTKKNIGGFAIPEA